MWKDLILVPIAFYFRNKDKKLILKIKLIIILKI